MDFRFHVETERHEERWHAVAWLEGDKRRAVAEGETEVDAVRAAVDAWIAEGWS